MSQQKLNKAFQNLRDAALDINEVPEMIDIMYKHKMNLFMWGNPGIGKTDAVRQFVSKMKAINPNFQSYYMTLAHMDPTDLSGLPTFDEKDGIKVTTWATPDFLPRDPNAQGVMFLDEYNNASGAVQNACQQLIQERRIGNYYLPDGIFIIAAGNPTGQNAYSTELSAPTKNRFAHIFVKTNKTAWTEYFLSQGMKPDTAKLVLGFLEQYPQYFEDTDAMDSGELNFGTPRNWSKFAQILDDNLNQNRAMIARLASAYIGNEGGQSFASYKEESDKYQNPMEIIEGKPFTCGNDQIGFYNTMYGVYATLYSWLDDKNRLADIKKGIHNLIEATVKVGGADRLTATVKKVAQSKLFDAKLMDFKDLERIAPIINEASKKE